MKSIRIALILCIAVVAALPAFALDPEPYTLGTSFSFRQQGVGNAIMTVHAGSSPSVNAMSPNGATIESNIGVAWLKPGQSYEVLFQSSGVSAFWLSFTAPSGYQVFVNGLPQDLVAGVPSFAPYWCYYTVELRPVLGGGRLDAGTFTGIDLGQAIGWEIGLGGLRSGRSAGRIGFRERDLTATTAPANRARLFYAPPPSIGQINVVRTGSSNQTLSQILTPQVFVALADLTSNPDAGYELRFYESAQAAWNGSAYTVSGSPWKVVKVEAPAADQLKISETEGAVTRVSHLSLTQGTVASGTYTWKLQEGGLGAWLRTRTQTSAASTGYREVTDCVFTGDSMLPADLASMIKYRYENIGGWGEEVRRVFAYPTVSTPDTAALVTEYDYYTDPAAPGNYRRVKSMTAPGGMWTAFSYYDDWDKRGQLHREYRPYMNSPDAVSFATDAGSGTVVTYDYAPDLAGRYSRVASRVEKIGGIETGRTLTDWTGSDSQRSRAAMDMFHSATASNRTYAETMSVFHVEEGGETWVIKDPDGPQTSISRLRGTSVNWGFAVDSSGNYWREVRVFGTWHSTIGTLVSSWDGQSFEPIYAVANRSTMEVLLRDPAGNIMKRDTYVFVGSGWSSVTSEWITFDAKGRLWQHADYNGSINTTNTWVDGRLQSTTDASGVRLDFVYDGLGRVTRSAKTGTTAALSSAIGGSSAVYDLQATIYTHSVYDGAGRVRESVTTPSAAKPNAGSAGANDLFSFATYDLAGRLKSNSIPGGFTTTTEYDHVLRKTTVTFPGPGSPHSITELYRDGQLKARTGTARLGESRVGWISSDGQRAVSTYNGQSWHIVYYDWTGRKANEWWPGGDGINYAQYYGYTAGGRLDLIWHNDGRATRLFDYDSLGFQIREGDDLDGNGFLEPWTSDRIREFETSYFNNNGWWKRDQTFVFSVENSAQRWPVSKVETQLNGFPAGRVARTDNYDQFGNCTTVSTQIERSLKRVTVTTDHPNSNKDTIAVSLNGLPVERQDSAGLLYQTKFDSLGRPSRNIDPRTGASLTLYLGGTSLVHRSYDALATAAYDANSSSPPVPTIEYAYDSAGRVSSTAVPNPKYGQGDNRSQLKSYTSYTLRGEIYQQWGDTAYPVQFEYDSYGRRTVMRSYRDPTLNWASSTWPVNAGGGDATLWVYDNATGNLKEKYDAANVSVAPVAPWAVAPKSGAKKVAYTYTRTNAVKTRTWARGVLTTYNYAPLTRELLSIDYSSTAASPDIAYTYNRLGMIATATDQATGTRTFVYSLGGSLELQREDLSAFYGSRRVVREYESTFGTIGRYNRLMVTDSSGNLDGYDLAFGYYSDGRVQSIYQTTYTYTPNSRLIEGVHTTAWNHTWLRAYDAKRDLVTYSTTVDNGWNLRAQFACGRDVLGRLNKSTRWGEVFSAYGANGLDSFYSYDDRSQVVGDSTNLQGSNVPLTGRDNYFVYDAFGNREATQQGAGGTPVDYIPNERNQIASIAGSVLTYDDDGNLTSDGTRTYSYDAENRLVKVAIGNSEHNYAYDYLGRRVQITRWDFVGGGWTQATDQRFLYDGWNLIKEFSGSSTHVANYVWGLDLSGSAQGAGGVGGLLFMYHYATNRVLQPIYDHNGNVHGMIDQFGLIAARYEYDAFGQTVTATGSHAAVNRFRFSTKFTDLETGLVYYGLRYYSPSLGRFINRDPIEESGGLNLYAFVQNNAVNGWDYLGMNTGTAGRFDSIFGENGNTGRSTAGGVAGTIGWAQSMGGKTDLDRLGAVLRTRQGNAASAADLRTLQQAQARLNSGRSVTIQGANGVEMTLAPGDVLMLSPNGSVSVLSAPAAIAAIPNAGSGSPSGTGRGVTHTVGVGFDSSVSEIDRARQSVNDGFAVINAILEAEGIPIRFGGAFDTNQSNKPAPSSGTYTFTDSNADRLAIANWNAIQPGQDVYVRLLVTNSSLMLNNQAAAGITYGNINIGPGWIIANANYLGGTSPVIAHELGHVGGYRDNSNLRNPRHSRNPSHIMSGAGGSEYDLVYLDSIRKIPRDP